MKRIITTFLFFLLTFIHLYSDIPTTIYVKYNASGLNDGTSWANAYTSFQSALDVTISGDKIWVAKGTYKPSYAYDLTNTPRYYHFRMIDGVEIYGGFAGTETLLNQRTDFGEGGANETILSGDLNGNDIFDSNGGGYQGTTGDDNCYIVFNHPYPLGLSSSAILDGFTIISGNANGIGSYGWGGGMQNYQNSPLLRNLTIKSNFAIDMGGGTFEFLSTTTITNCIFKSNVGSNGGGIFNYSSSPAIINCLFYSNTAINGGGAIDNWDSSPILTNSTISKNNAPEGGGVRSLWSSPTFNNCIIWGNSASGNGNQLYLIGNVQTTCSNSCFDNNAAGDVIYTEGAFMLNTNNIHTYPKFVDFTNDDFRIAGTSPCKNTGNNAFNAETYDIRGQLRIQNATIDRGAYEWTSGTDPLGTTIYVKYDATGSNDGSGWANAYTSFQTGLNNAMYSDKIWVAKGTYKPSSAYNLTNSSRFYHFRMIEGVEIYGGFAGTETATNQRINFGSGGGNETVLSGDLGVIGDYNDNSLHVFYHPGGLGLTSLAVLDGFTVTKGYANSLNPHNNGAGFYNASNSPTLRNLIISNNISFDLGGGICNESSNTILSNVLIINNSAYGNGGGIFMRNSNVTMNNTTISKNYAWWGGGVYSWSSSSSTMNNGIIWGNTAAYTGFQIYSLMTLNNSCYANLPGDVSTPQTATNCINTNPLFADEVNNDFRLCSTSLAVNTGNNAYNSATYDIRNQSRIQNAIIDMGAYEWTSGIDPELSTLSTTAISSITPFTAVSGGNITNGGFSSISDRGIVWSTTATPTLISNEDGHTSDGTGIGLFVSNMSSLLQNNIYHVRAYSTNAAGTSYGNELICTTMVATQAKKIVFTNIQQYQLSFTWTNGDGNGRVVLGKEDAVISPNPLTNNTTYNANFYFKQGTKVDNGYIVYKGTGNSVTVKSLSRGHLYFFKVFEYYGSAGSEAYNQVNAEYNPHYKGTLRKEIVESNIFENNTKALSVFPNPSSEKVILNLNFDDSKSIEVTVYDVNGNIVMSPYFSYPVTNGNSQLSMDIKDLPTGIYQVLVNTGDEVVFDILNVVR